MTILLLDAAPLAEPFRTIVVIAAIAGFTALPLGLAFWRLQSRNRPRHVRIPYTDRSALIYQVTKILRLVGFSQGADTGSTVLFQPNAMQKMFGMAPIELLFDQPAAARLTATNGIMRRIVHNFRGATEEKHTGRTPFPMKGFATAFGLLLGIMVIVIGVVALATRHDGTNLNGSTTQDLDVAQPIYLTADQASRGAYLDIKIAHTGESVNVHIPAGIKDGTRLRLPGKGRASPQGGRSGDFYLLVHLQ